MGGLSARLLPGIFAPFQNTAIALLLGYCCVEVSKSDFMGWGLALRAPIKRDGFRKSVRSI